MPIESNPTTMGKMLRKLGLAEEYNCHDVLSTEEWALAMVPQPVLAVLLLFCVKPATEALRTEQEERLRAAGTAPPRDLWFTEQHIPNACGTIGLLHAVINNSTAFGGEISLGEPRVVKRGRRAGARGPAHCLLDS
jgi:ubiquitin carboxyl-terminal hydrolase L3